MAHLIKSTKLYLAAIIVLLLAAFLATGLVLANDSASHSTSPVYWAWGEQVSGSSTVVRNSNGVSATYEAAGFTPGNAVTGWFIVFNNPEACIPVPFDCGPDDMFHPDYAPGQGPSGPDFLLQSGNVIGGDGIARFGGHLRAGDNSGSGLAELVCPDTLDCTVGLTNPQGALIVMAAHDHGPAQTGQTLSEQIASFLGGCVGPFNGDAYGFATGAGDIPDVPGECSTVQVSPHTP